MEPTEEWCTIPRALEIIMGELRTSMGHAQARLIEACAVGNVRSRVPPERLTADDGKFSIDSAVINFFRQAGPISSLIWKGAVIDGDALRDRSRCLWSPVEVNAADLRFDLAGAERGGSSHRRVREGGQTLRCHSREGRG
jgi:hypothetical protein